jgi:hypothetical protein
MNWLRSFRWRILLGAFFWTLGLIPVGYMVFFVVHHACWRESGRYAPASHPLAVSAGNCPGCVMAPAAGSKGHIPSKYNRW